MSEAIVTLNNGVTMPKIGYGVFSAWERQVRSVVSSRPGTI